jgi:hypothetical protein
LDEEDAENSKKNQKNVDSLLNEILGNNVNSYRFSNDEETA